MGRNWFAKRLGYAEVLSGVYRILNLTTGKCYIGSSQDIYHRWRNHYWQLSKKEHSAKLQAVWDDPTSTWVFGIVELVPKAKLLSSEAKWINFYGSYTDGYNIALDPKAPMRGRKHSPKTIESYRQRKPNPAQLAALLAHALAPRTKAHRDNVGNALKGRTFPHMHTSRPLSEETKQKIGKSNKGKTGHKHTEKENRKLSEKLKGRTFPHMHNPRSEEWKRKISESNKRTRALKKLHLSHVNDGVEPPMGKNLASTSKKTTKAAV